LPVFGNKMHRGRRVAYFSWESLYHTANDHVCVTMTYEGYLWLPSQLMRNIFYMPPQCKFTRQTALVCAEPSKHGRNYRMAMLF
jgi:hypothetical protein